MNAMLPYLLRTYRQIYYQDKMKAIEGAIRLTGFDKPTVWTIMTPLAIKTESANLGQGFPSWQPPDFYLKNLTEAIGKSNHQYVRAYGSLNYTKAIADFHKKSFGALDHENNIVTVNGGVEGLYCCIMGLVNNGEEVIVFDPSYDCYRPQVQMAGGKTIGIPLKPKKSHSREEILKRIEGGVAASEEDDWAIDFELFEKSLNPKTKLLILNTPHNPSGKVFTEEELAELARILQKHPQVIVVEDNVYEGMTFDEYFKKPLPKLCFQPGMYERSLSIYSAGKIFAATGVRSGWVIGPSQLIKSVRSVHQYNVFCSYNVIENTLANSLVEITRAESSYIEEYASRLTKHRDILVRELLASRFDFDLWIPRGGYFIICDISKVPVMEKYFLDEQGNRRTKDYAFAYQLAYEHRVVCIPCSPFYGKDNEDLGARYVRFAFCKDEELIREAGRRLRS